MVSRPLRKITLGETANSAHEEWLEALTAALDDPACDRCRLCRDTLFQIYHPAVRSYEEKLADLNLSPALITCRPFELLASYSALEPTRLFMSVRKQRTHLLTTTFLFRTLYKI